MAKLNEVRRFEDVTVNSNIDLTVELNKREVEKDVFEYEFLLNWDEEQAKDPESRVSMHWNLPCVDVQYMWHPNCRPRRVLDAFWRLNVESYLSGSAPLALLFNSDDMNTYTFTTDEVKKVTSVSFGVDDGKNTIAGDISMGLQQFVGKSSDRLLVRADFRRIPYYKALDDVRIWWEKVLDLEPMPVPDIARKPLYNTWYSFTQNVNAKELEEELRQGKELGMEMCILDDGWHTNDNNRGYGYTGDWEVCTDKIPDIKEHVKRVHAMGMKYMMWYSVPFVGFYSKNWERFKDKILFTIDRNSVGVLDPRYPEVREHLIRIYENALREYDLDGIKLDFIDRFIMPANVKVSPEMDYLCVQEATERLMTDIMHRLHAIKDNLTIEFRQRYIGPAMRRYGNMFRVADCPNDIATNRMGIVDIRLISGKTAAHADMITWHDDETVEDAALQILNVMFGVVQFSRRLVSMRPDHKAMTTFWLKFAKDNIRILQESEFVAYEPHFLYPVIKAFDEKEEIIGVYANKKVICPDMSKERSRIINATKQPVVYLSVEQDNTVDMVTYDCMGNVTAREKLLLHKGCNEVTVPRSGLLEMVKMS